jgi:hypothetical protein
VINSASGREGERARGREYEGARGRGGNRTGTTEGARERVDRSRSGGLRPGARARW